jgi:hypothetical protein
VADSTASTGLKWATPSGGGKVLQVVQATYSTETSTTSTSLVDTGLSASITPTLNTSKILVIYNINIRRNNTTDIDVQSYFAAFRGATNITGTLTIGNYGTATMTYLQYKSNLNWSYLDSPATTSSTTYKVQMRSNAAAITTTAQTDGNTSTMILMEIGA